MRNHWSLVVFLCFLALSACETSSPQNQPTMDTPSTTVIPTTDVTENGNTEKIDHPAANNSFQQCEGLQSPFDTNHYLIQLSEKAMARLDWESKYRIDTSAAIYTAIQDTVQKYLSKVFPTIKDIDRDSVKYVCPCGLILMEVNHPIDPTDGRGNAHAAKPKSQSDGMFDGIEFNYKFPIRPRITLLSQKEFEDTVPPRPQNNSKRIRTKVAIVDSGINSSHDSLKTNLWYNPIDTTRLLRGQHLRYDEDRNGIVQDTAGFNFYNRNHDVSDYTGHGTHVAGIVNGTYTNDYFSDKQFNESIELMNVKIMGQDSDTSSLFHAVCGLQYAIDQGADIINASWGYYAQKPSLILDKAIKNAQENAIIIVTASGNDGVDIDECLAWPSNFSTKYENVITVGAGTSIQRNGAYSHELTNWSNYGKKAVSFAAQGAGILSTVPMNAAAKNDGTSMAAPAVTRYLAWLRYKCTKEVTLKEITEEASGTTTTGSTVPLPETVHIPDELKPQESSATTKRKRAIYQCVLSRLNNAYKKDFEQLSTPNDNDKQLKNNIILKSKIYKQ